jgi:putative endopeptidase
MRITRYRKLIYNVQAPTPRDTFCASTADSLIGQLVGRVFVLKHFPDLAATRAHELIDRLEEAFEHIINSVGWMDAATKVKAINKLKKIINKIGYPEHWPDYSNLLFHKETFLQNVIDATHHNFDSYISWLGKAGSSFFFFLFFFLFSILVYLLL